MDCEDRATTSTFAEEFSACEKPYQFHFSPPRDNPSCNGQTRWIVNRVNAPTPYLCFRARLTLAWCNPLTLAFILMLLIFYIFSSLLVRNLEMCTRLGGMTFSGGQADAENGIVGVVQTQILNSANASLVNAQTSAHNYIELLSTLYVAAFSSAVTAAYGSAQNVTTSIVRVSNERLTAASNLTRSLRDALEQIDGALVMSGLYNSSVINSTLDVFENNTDTAVNSNLSLLAHSPRTYMDQHNISTSAKSSVDKVFDTAFRQLSEITGSENSTKRGRTVTTASDLSGRGAMSAALAPISSKTREVLLGLALTAIIAVIPASILDYYKWHYILDLSKQVEQASGLQDSMQYLQSGSYFFTTVVADKLAPLFKSRNHYIYFQWILHYVASEPMATMLAAALCALLLGLCQSIVLHTVQDTLNGHDGASPANSTASIPMDPLTDLVGAQKAANLATQRILTGMISNTSTFFSDFEDTLNAQLNGTLTMANLTSQFETPWQLFREGFAVANVVYSGQTNSSSTDAGYLDKVLHSTIESFITCRSVTYSVGIGLITIWCIIFLLSIIYAAIMLRRLPCSTPGNTYM